MPKIYSDSFLPNVLVCSTNKGSQSRPFICGAHETCTFFYFANAKALHFISLGGPPGPRSRSKHSLAPIRLYLTLAKRVRNRSQMAK